MIELDRRAVHDDVIRRAGGHPIGERGGLVWFTDPKTKTTLVLEPHEVTVERVQQKLLESRRRFRWTFSSIKRFFMQCVSFFAGRESPTRER
jgi:hypothetical protein